MNMKSALMPSAAILMAVEDWSLLSFDPACINTGMHVSDVKEPTKAISVLKVCCPSVPRLGCRSRAIGSGCILLYIAMRPIVKVEGKDIVQLFVTASYFAMQN